MTMNILQQIIFWMMLVSLMQCYEQGPSTYDILNANNNAFTDQELSFIDSPSKLPSSYISPYLSGVNYYPTSYSSPFQQTVVSPYRNFPNPSLLPRHPPFVRPFPTYPLHASFPRQISSVQPAAIHPLRNVPIHTLQGVPSRLSYEQQIPYRRQGNPY